jgi:phage shock protein E
VHFLVAMFLVHYLGVALLLKNSLIEAGLTQRNHPVKQQLKSILLSTALASGSALAGANNIIIDVRSGSEWAAGHLQSAQHLELGMVAQNIHSLVEDKDQRIYLYCRSGNRSGQAKTILQELGYTNVVNAGGLEDASRTLEREITK